MTREEAIEKLNYMWFKEFRHFSGTLEENMDAIEMAIKALEQEDILDKIREDINHLTVYYTTKVKGTSLVSQRAVNRVIDKYRK